ncbi:hypothetical protein A5886_001730 [Enterococcus sp. 8G7_MSG3316]|uniref:ABC transporter permease n=1 Tax=Candidatus Enterococcus testudinis TaxID=1834191 RepID=A0A242A6S0_9ENTE|nr:ABC-2 family transporter protein [Enterococcus sp. 8G7_MSG3316]OTN76652.1 hypothetical protein A5886_001730 [Enterococcus sp. 8G7_MSG3316]
MIAYMTLVKKNIQAQFEYNISTYLLIAGQFIAQFTFIFTFYLLFQSLGSIRNYSFAQALLVYGCVNISYTCGEILGKGINNISELIRQGALDIYFLRPQAILLQVMGSGVEISRVGRLIQSFILLGMALNLNEIEWNLIQVVTLFLIVIGGIILFLGIYLFFGSLTFFSIQSINISILLMGSGSDCLHYPVDVMGQRIQQVLTYVFPFAIINYYPFLFIFGKSEQVLFAFTPLVSIPFFILTLGFWVYCIGRYSSTGS